MSVVVTEYGEVDVVLFIRKYLVIGLIIAFFI